MAKILEKILSFKREERLFVLFAMLSGFFICAEYAVVRPVSNAVFITAYGTQTLPYVWLTVVPLNFLAVFLYNRFLPRLGCKTMFLIVAALIVSGNTFAAFFLKDFRILNFIFYVWKEVYVLLMFQQLWSVINSTISIDRAKYLYGFIAAVGGLGSFLGSYIPSFQAVHFGSENLLFSTLPFYGILSILYIQLLKYTGNDSKIGRWQEGSSNFSSGASGSAQEHAESEDGKFEKKPPQPKPIFESRAVDSHSSVKVEKVEPLGSLKKGFQLISASRQLTFILLIVALMQMTSAIVYYQFNLSLEATILEKDLRTEYAGKIMGITNFLTIGLQLFGSFLLVHFFGLKRSHILIPVVLGLNAIGSFLSPSFLMASVSFLMVKTFDFSIFGILKEMLYIPLKKEEKFQARAWIDVFGYRSAKALASLFILAFQWAALSPAFLSFGLILFFALWVGLVIYLFDRREAAVLENT